MKILASTIIALILLTACDRQGGIGGDPAEVWPTVEMKTPTKSSAATYWGDSPNGHTWHQATTAQKKWICDQMANKGTKDSQFWMDFFSSFYITEGQPDPATASTSMADASSLADPSIPKPQKPAPTISVPVSGTGLANSKLQKLFLNAGLKDFSDESLLVVKVINGGDKELHTEGFEDFKKMPNIESIAIGGNNSTLSDNDLKNLSLIELPNIKSINLPFTPNITPDGVEALLNSYPTLKNVSVINCPNFTEKDGRALEAILPSCEITGNWNF